MFLPEPCRTEATSALYARDLAEDGYVGNLTRLWAWRPDVFNAFLNARAILTEKAAFSRRERALLVCATAATVGDSYCALAWGTILASETDPITAAAVLQRKEAAALTPREGALVKWAGKVAREPNAITVEDVDRLHCVGITDEEIFNATVFVAFRLAFSTVNDALGARPDQPLAAAAPAVVRDAVVYGRSVSDSPAK
ncbi:hypothetical protein AYO41_04655 [Verrucomicrobia bacterium SCGC AG-212-E04]|nr:hypothetical protein AYO41_04655 [Verrucomicrobia bacterium SCGC AG-212-E04]